MNVRLTTGVILLAFIGAFVFVTGAEIFARVFWSGDVSASQAFYGAFLGAFFAFLFGRMGSWVSGVHARQARARNALVSLQHRLLDIINIIHDEQFVFRKLFEFEEHLNGGPPRPVFFNSFSALPQLDDLIPPLLNLDLVNELKGRSIEMRKWNNSVDTWQRAFDAIRNAFTARHIDDATYIVNARESTKTARILSRMLDALRLDLTKSLARIRVLSRGDTLFGDVIRLTTRTTYPKNIEALAATELERIKAEAEEVDKSEVGKERRKLATEEE